MEVVDLLWAFWGVCYVIKHKTKCQNNSTLKGQFMDWIINQSKCLNDSKKQIWSLTSTFSGLYLRLWFKPQGHITWSSGKTSTTTPKKHFDKKRPITELHFPASCASTGRLKLKKSHLRTQQVNGEWGHVFLCWRTSNGFIKTRNLRLLLFCPWSFLTGVWSTCTTNRLIEAVFTDTDG